MPWDAEEEMRRLLAARTGEPSPATLALGQEADALGAGFELPLPKTPSVSDINSRQRAAARAARGGYLGQQPVAKMREDDAVSPAPMVEATPLSPSDLAAYAPSQPKAREPLYSPAELAAANEYDASRARSRGIEAAGRALVAGLTRTPQAETMLTQGDALDRLIAMKQRERGAALGQRQADLHEKQIASNERVADINTRNAEARLALQKALNEANVETAGRKETREEKKTEADIGHQKVLEQQGWTNLSIERQKAEAAAAKADKEKLLAPTQVAELADYDTAVSGLDQLLDLHKSSNMSGAGDFGGAYGKRIENAVTPEGANTAVTQYNDKARASAQVVGKILEGGKLAAGDEPKYARMLPQPGDSPERAAAKVANVKALLAEQKSRRTQAFASVGYKTPTSEPPKTETPAGDTVEVVLADGRRSRVTKRQADLLVKHGKATLP